MDAVLPDDIKRIACKEGFNFFVQKFPLGMPLNEESILVLEEDGWLGSVSTIAFELICRRLPHEQRREFYERKGRVGAVFQQWMLGSHPDGICNEYCDIVPAIIEREKARFWFAELRRL